MKANHARASFLLASLLAGLVCTLAVSPAWGQAKADAPKEAAKDKGRAEAKKGADKRDDAGPAKGAKSGAKDARQEAKGAAPKDAPRAGDAKRPAKAAPQDAQGPRKGPGDAAKDVPPPRRDADDSRDKRAPEKSRDVDRDAGKAPREDARDKAKGAAEAARDRRDVDRPEARRDTRQATDRSSRRSERRDFRAEDVRSADIGLWFNASDQGLVISDVASSGAISKVGFRDGDRIVSVNGQRIAREADFVRFLFAPDIRDQRVKVIVIREGREEIVYVEPVVLIQEYTVVEADPLEEFGIVIDDRYTDRLIVWKVIPRSPAFYAGIRAGDVITTFDGRQVVAVNDLVQLVSQARADEVTIGVHRNQASRQLRVDVSRFR